MNGVGFPKKEDPFDVGNRSLARLDEEGVGAGATDRVEDRVEPQRIIVALRFAQPPIGEYREFLRAVGFAGVQGQAASGLAVTLALAQQPEITGAQKCAQFVPPLLAVQLIEHPEAGVAGVGRNLVLDLEAPVIEEILHETDRLDMGEGEFINVDRFFV